MSARAAAHSDSAAGRVCARRVCAGRADMRRPSGYAPAERICAGRRCPHLSSRSQPRAAMASRAPPCAGQTPSTGATINFAHIPRGETPGPRARRQVQERLWAGRAHCPSADRSKAPGPRARRQLWERLGARRARICRLVHSRARPWRLARPPAQARRHGQERRRNPRTSPGARRQARERDANAGSACEPGARRTCALADPDGRGLARCRCGLARCWRGLDRMQMRAGSGEGARAPAHARPRLPMPCRGRGCPRPSLGCPA